MSLVFPHHPWIYQWHITSLLVCSVPDFLNSSINTGNILAGAMFIGSVSTKNVGKNQNDIEIRDTWINPLIMDTHLSLLCIGPLMSEVRWETVAGYVLQMQGLPPFLVFDDRDTYFLPLVQLGAILLPHPHWLINWTRNSRIITCPNFKFIYTSPGTGISTSFHTLLLHTQIQASASAAWLSSVLHCPILHNNLGQHPPFISPFTRPISKMGVFTALSKVAVLFTYMMYLNCLAFLKYYHPG